MSICATLLWRIQNYTSNRTLINVLPFLSVITVSGLGWYFIIMTERTLKREISSIGVDRRGGSSLSQPPRPFHWHAYPQASARQLNFLTRFFLRKSEPVVVYLRRQVSGNSRNVKIFPTLCTQTAMNTVVSFPAFHFRQYYSKPF